MINFRLSGAAKQAQIGSTNSEITNFGQPDYGNGYGYNNPLANILGRSSEYQPQQQSQPQYMTPVYYPPSQQQQKPYYSYPSNYQQVLPQQPYYMNQQQPYANLG